jgi:hypothetical protein
LRRRTKPDDFTFGNLSFLDILANSIGAITFIFLLFFIVISGLVKPSQFRLMTDSLPDARAGMAYKLSLAASGGVEPYKWSISSGALPENMSINSRLGLLKGAPAKEGTYRFTLEITDGTDGQPQIIRQPLVLRVRRPSDKRIVDNMPLEISTGKMTPVAVGVHYDITLAATGGEEPYSWSVVDSLPPGLVFQNDRLIGTPQVVGDWRFNIRVRDAAGANYEKQFVLSVAPKTVLTEDALELFDISTQRLPRTAVRQEYNVALAAVGGVPPYTWALDSGELPRGLILNPNTGVISGEPLRASRETFVIAAYDGRGGKAIAKRRLSINVDPVYFEAEARNPLLTWWVILLGVFFVAAGFVLLSALLIGVQCPWDRSWRCKAVGKDANGHTVYTCKHGHRFVNEPKLLRGAKKDHS